MRIKVPAAMAPATADSFPGSVNCLFVRGTFQKGMWFMTECFHKGSLGSAIPFFKVSNTACMARIS